MPFRGNVADGFFEGRLAAEVGRIVRGLCGIRVHPITVMPAKVAAVELVVGIDPATQDHQFHLGQHLGVVVFGVLRVRWIGQQVDQGTLIGAEILGRQVGAVVVALIAFQERCEFRDNGAGQLFLRKLLVGSVVLDRHFARKVQLAFGIGFAVARDALGVEDRLDIGGVVDHLSGLAVAAVFDQIARLRLRHAGGRVRAIGVSETVGGMRWLDSPWQPVQERTSPGW